MLIFFYPLFFTIFYLFDLIFTVAAILYVDYRNIIRIPEIYILKFLWTAIWIAAAFNTTRQYLGGQRIWKGRWTRDDIYHEVGI
jgi:hypothetical protein